MKIEQTLIDGIEDKADLSAAMQALSQFYAAFNNRDLQAMAQNWAQTDEAAMSNPLGGIKRGWREIEAVYQNIFNGAARVRVEFYDYTLHESPEMFVVVGRERGEFAIAATKIDLNIRTNRIYRLIENEWRQIHHHGSIDDARLLEQYQKAVRGEL